MSRGGVAGFRWILAIAALVAGACGGDTAREAAQPGVPTTPAASPEMAEPAAFWNSATVYFLLTDRFENGDPGNDRALDREQDGAVLRSYMGGDLAGVLARLESGYFDSLGVNVLWMTPFVEQNRGSTDEGTGRTYSFHGYWTQDWTAVDPALGTYDDLRAVVDEAHRRGIRVLMDAVINHTGPVTDLDPAWPQDWVRTGPRCQFRDYATTVDCTLVANLPDILTDSDTPVELPPGLRAKWEAEGRLDAEQAELEAFFARTGYPRAPRYYLIKWLTDWVRELGIDGYRVDTAKHFEESVSVELKNEAVIAFDDWKTAHPADVLDALPFYMMGEVYNYEAGAGRDFDFGGGDTVDFFDYGYDGMINFGFKRDASGSIDDLFTKYSSVLHDQLRGLAILNYLSSHDDGAPFDPDRENAIDAGTRLLLGPGGAQIYYGDELARPLHVEGAEGDANLRSFMNWADLGSAGSTASMTLDHWRRLGQFRHAHPAVGAGVHRELQAEPYIFSRTLVTGGREDRVLVAMSVPAGEATIPVFDVFTDGTVVVDGYSGRQATVTNGSVRLMTDSGIVLLGEER